MDKYWHNLTIFLQSDININRYFIVIITGLCNTIKSEVFTERGKVMEETKKRKLSPKTLIGITIGAVILIGGTVAAYIFANLSDKQKYFLAEKESIAFMNEQIEQRYESEFDWLETTREEPTETNYELSAESDIPIIQGGMGVDPAQLINNSTISYTHAADIKNKKISGNLSANIGEMKVDNITFHLNSKQFMVGLPFLEQFISLKGENVGKLLQEIDPATFTGEEKVDFNTLFEEALSEDDKEYIQEEYGKFIYDQLPDEAFKTESETIKVHDKSLETDKITMQLSEEKVKEILSKTIEKLRKDDKMKELFRQFLEEQLMGMAAMPEIKKEIDQTMEDYDTSLEKAKEDIDGFQIPKGLTSTIWVHDDLIAQRDFNIQLGQNKERLTTIEFKGTQLLQEERQQFNLALNVDDAMEGGKVSLSGDLSWKDKKAEDSLKLAFDEQAFTYDGKETLKDGKRDFERTINLQDPYTGDTQLIWNGTSNYEKDQMNEEHSFAFTDPNVDQNLFSLHANVEGKTVDSVDIPSKDKTTEIGTMNKQELMEFFETEVTPKFQGWMVEMLSATGNMEF